MPLVTLNYSFGSDGREIAQSVAQNLGVALYDDDTLKTILKGTAQHKSFEYDFNYQAPGFWERLMSREPKLFIDFMEAAVYRVAQDGEGVIIGHGSQMLLRDFSCAFHVRLLSDPESRLSNLVENQGLNRDAAADLIKKYDRSQATFFEYAFEIDFDTPSLYDLTINTGKMNRKTISRLILEALDSDDVQACSFNALSAMKKRSLERSIQAALLEEKLDIQLLNISVDADGKADLSGAAVSQDEKERIIEIVSTLDGVSEVDAAIFVWKYTSV